MAYTTPATWSTSQIVTATQLNEQLRDNMTAVHDAIYTCTHNTTAGAAGTEYQNTTGKTFMLQIATVPSTTNLENTLQIWCGSTSPVTADKVVASQNCGAIATGYSRVTVHAVVPAGFYYYLNPTPTTPNIVAWTKDIIG